MFGRRMRAVGRTKIFVVVMKKAELYSSANGMQKRDAVEILKEFQGKISWRNEARILDVGCGSGEVTTGILLPRLPKGFKELVGLDISLEMIQHARNLHPHPKVSFIQFDIAQNSEGLLEELTKIVRTSPNEIQQGLPEESQKIQILVNNRKIFDCRRARRENIKLFGYDVIFSLYCLHWISNQRLAIKNIYKLLKPGGESLLVFLVKSPIFTLYRKLSTIDLWKEYMRDVENFIPFYQDSTNPLGDFSQILRSAGFEILTADCRERSYMFDNFSSLRNAITAVNPFVSRIPHDLQEEFINECLRQTGFLNLTEFNNNTYRVSYKLIVAHIRKP